MDASQTHTDLTRTASFDQFLNDFNQSAKCVLPPQSKRYDRVCVLLIRWQDDDLGTEAEVTELETVFKDLYHYETERYLIPSIDSTTHLEDYLVDWRRTNDTGDSLLILYYGGHGILENAGSLPSRSKWAPTLKPGYPSVVWSDLQGILQRSKSDVLFILDCCFAATASRGSGAKEGLWACNSEGMTTGVNNNSFTQNIIVELKALCHTRYNILILHQRLMARYKKPGQHRLLTEPWYTYMCGETASSIELLPQTPTNITSDIEVPITETLVLLAVRLKSLNIVPNTLAWQSWLHQSGPDDVESVLVLGELQTRDLLRLGTYNGSYPLASGPSMPPSVSEVHKSIAIRCRFKKNPITQQAKMPSEVRSLKDVRKVLESLGYADGSGFGSFAEGISYKRQALREVVGMLSFDGRKTVREYLEELLDPERRELMDARQYLYGAWRDETDPDVRRLIQNAEAEYEAWETQRLGELSREALHQEIYEELFESLRQYMMEFQHIILQDITCSITDQKGSVNPAIS